MLIFLMDIVYISYYNEIYLPIYIYFFFEIITLKFTFLRKISFTNVKNEIGIQLLNNL